MVGFVTDKQIRVRDSLTTPGNLEFYDTDATNTGTTIRTFLTTLSRMGDPVDRESTRLTSVVLTAKKLIPARTPPSMPTGNVSANGLPPTTRS